MAMCMLHRICMGADMAQTVKAIAEAEAYPGPSLIIAYSMYQHGIKRYGQGSDREAGCRVRLLEQLPLQPGS